MTSTTVTGYWLCEQTSGRTRVAEKCFNCQGRCEFRPVLVETVSGGRLTSFPEEWAAARNSSPVSEQWLEGLLAHKDDGPIGEGAARDLLREVMRLRGLSTGQSSKTQVGNATIHTFKTSGKWYAEGRAKIAKELFEGLNNGSRRAWILTNNGEKCPGLSSRGETMIWVVLPDEDVDYGFPLLLRPIGD